MQEPKNEIPVLTLAEESLFVLKMGRGEQTNYIIKNIYIKTNISICFKFNIMVCCDKRNQFMIKLVSYQAMFASRMMPGQKFTLEIHGINKPPMCNAMALGHN